MMDDASRASLIADVKRQLQNEMGLLPVHAAARAARELRRALLLRRPRDEQLRHGRLPRRRLLHHRQARRRRARPGRRGRRAQDHLDQADVQGPAARRAGRRLRRREGRSPLRRLGDHQGQGADRPAGAERRTWPSPSISPTRSSASATTTRRASSCRPATSASAPRTNLVTCLTDGHPGVSGGGVLNRNGELVGIPIGRMQGDYRFSFILPLRQEMFKKIPHFND